MVSGLIIPAFSPAISLIVSPRNAMWSLEIGVITSTRVVPTTFVASSLPPRPVSSTTKSHPLLLKYSIARAVSASNSVGELSPSTTMLLIASAISVVWRASSSSAI